LEVIHSFLGQAALHDVRADQGLEQDGEHVVVALIVPRHVLGHVDGEVLVDDLAAESTKNRAERSLRDLGVIARKASCGNKTERGKIA
jgi:hypothetical protein